VLSFDEFVSEVREIMDHIPSGVLISLDTDGDALLANSAARELLGLPLTGDISLSLPKFFAPFSVRETKPDLLPLVQSMRTGRLIDAEDYEVAHHDGTRRSCSMSAGPLYDIGNEVRGGFAILVDVSVLRTQDRSLRFDELSRLIARERPISDALRRRAELTNRLPEVNGFVLSGIPQSAEADRAVGRDWYDAFELPDGRIGLAIGNVAGSRVTASVTMSKLRTAIRSTALIPPEPTTMLDAANSTLALHDPHGKATVVAAVLDPGTAQLWFASAGHPLPILREPTGRLENFEGTSPPLDGVNSRADARTHRTMLGPGSVAVFYTDGLLYGDDDGTTGTRRLRQILAKSVISNICADDMADVLHREMVGPQTRSDDGAILTIARSARSSGQSA
jgi:hypothetical protein